MKRLYNQAHYQQFYNVIHHERDLPEQAYDQWKCPSSIQQVKRGGGFGLEAPYEYQFEGDSFCCD